jgi:hypothetical protein
VLQLKVAEAAAAPQQQQQQDEAQDSKVAYGSFEVATTTCWLHEHVQHVLQPTQLANPVWATLLPIDARGIHNPGTFKFGCTHVLLQVAAAAGAAPGHPSTSSLPLPITCRQLL